MKKILIVLIFLSIIARFISLDLAPPHLSNDEISASYAAYSISKTLKDGTGKTLPIFWSSTGGYGSPLAIYIPLTGIKIFGNTDFAVRLPSAILGSLTVIFIGLLVFELSKNKGLALLSSFILAFSPWHFTASRWALESNYALFFLVLGIYLFFLGKRKNKAWIVVFGFVSFVLSVYSYYTEWILTPLVITSLLFFYRRDLNKKVYLVSIFIFGILLIPLFYDFLNHLNSTRASSEFIANDIGVGRVLAGHPSLFEKGQIILKAIFDKYSAYYSLEYLFFYGAKILPKDNPYQFGFFLAPLLVPFLVGLYKLKNYFAGNSAFVYFLLIVSPLTASLTLGDINNWRSLPQLLPITVVAAAGTLFLWNFAKKKLWIKALGIALWLVTTLYFIPVYFVHFPAQRGEDYQYGYKQMALYIREHPNEYEKIIIDPRFGNKNYYYSGVPSLYIPFYTYMDPVKLHEANMIPNGISFDKYEFRNIYWEKEVMQKNYLYIVPYDNIPATGGLKVVKEIQLPSRKVQFLLYSRAD